MKLYATVRSERATKGQGGNGLLTITLYGENREPLGDILFTSCQHDPVKCHKGHGLAQVRVFNSLLDVEVVDYPDTVLPPYLEKGETKKCIIQGCKSGIDDPSAYCWTHGKERAIAEGF